MPLPPRKGNRLFDAVSVREVLQQSIHPETESSVWNCAEFSQLEIPFNEDD